MVTQCYGLVWLLLTSTSRAYTVKPKSSSSKQLQHEATDCLNRADFLRFAASGSAAVVLSIPSAAAAAAPKPSSDSGNKLDNSLDALRRETQRVQKEARKEITKAEKNIKKEVKKVEKKAAKEVKTIKREVKKETKKAEYELTKIKKEATKEVSKVKKEVSKEAQKMSNVVSKETQNFRQKAGVGKVEPANGGIDVSKLKVCDGVKTKCVQ